MEPGDWRAQLHADSRERIVNKIMETLMRHLPFSADEGLRELKKIAVRFEEKIYANATSQSDYLRKISLKMLTMETPSQSSLPNPVLSNSAASLHSISQMATGNPNGGNWQEEGYQKEMDISNWMTTKGGSIASGDASMESGNWRVYLQAYSRERIVNKIMDTMMMHLPSSGHEGLQELKKIAMRFEERIYVAATSQSDYLRKISLKMMSMQTNKQNSMSNSKLSNSTDSTTQMGNASGGDWQEEIYQKIKAMSAMYLVGLKDMQEKCLTKLPQQPKNEQFEKLKLFKTMLDRYIQFLQLPKSSMLANYKEKLSVYEKQIAYVINSNRRKPASPPQQIANIINLTGESQQTLHIESLKELQNSCCEKRKGASPEDGLIEVDKERSKVVVCEILRLSKALRSLEEERVKLKERIAEVVAKKAADEEPVEATSCTNKFKEATTCYKAKYEQFGKAFQQATTEGLSVSVPEAPPAITGAKKRKHDLYSHSSKVVGDA